MSRQRTARDTDINIMGTGRNPYIVDVPTKNFFTNIFKKKDAKTSDEHDKKMIMSQAALEAATNRARVDVNNAMVKANVDLTRDEEELAKSQAKFDKSNKKHADLEQKNAAYSALLQHDQVANLANGQDDGDQE